MESPKQIKHEEDSSCPHSVKIESVNSSNADSENVEMKQEDQLEIPRAIFKCNVCLKSYSNNSNLRRHQQRHHPHLQEARISEENKKQKKKTSTRKHTQNEETPIQCPMCPQAFATRRIASFINHLQVDHNHTVNNKSGQDKHEKSCPLCPKCFGTTGGLRDHVINIHVKHKPIECEVCKSKNKCKRFIDQNSLDQHMKFIHGPKRVTCEICLMTFTHTYLLNRHRKNHLEVSKFKCKHCSKTFPFKYQMHRHLVAKHKEKSSKVKTYTCELCGNVYFRLSVLQIHVADVHVVDKSVECQVCGKMFLDKDHLTHHQKYAHNGKMMVLNCDVCSKQFRHRSNFVRHLGVEHGRFFECRKCSRSFGTKQDFDLHSAIVSNSSELQCYICLVVLPSPCSFDIHIKSHAKQSESKVDEVQVKEEESPAGIKTPDESRFKGKGKRFKCDLCPKTFGRSSYLGEHRKQVHPGIKWKCKVCSKTFKLQHQLTNHERIHSLVRPWECQVCQKTFKSQGELTGHKKIHYKVKPHECLICHKSYVNPQQLKIHMGNYHGGEKPFKCHLCDKSWVLKSHLNVHLLSHLEDKTFDCDECGKSFKSNMHLKNHRRIVHLAIKKPTIFPGVSKKVLNSNDDSLVFVCRLCDFGTKDGKEVAFHNIKHGLPKVLLSKAVLCARHTSCVFPVKIENTSLDSSSSGNGDLICIKKEEPGESLPCSLCSPLDSLPTNSVGSHTIRPQFKCKLCSKFLATKSSLYNHLKFHSNGENTCLGCKKQFSTFFNLRRHAKICGL